MISNEFLFTFAAIYLRVLGAVVILPFGNFLHNIGKLSGFSLVLSIFFYNGNSALNSFSYSALFFEFIIGLCLTLPAALTIECIRGLGELFDNQRGLSFASYYEPSSGVFSSAVSHLSGYFSVLLLISSGLLEGLLSALAKSFEVIPVLSPDFTSISQISVNIIYLLSFLSASMFQVFLVCAILFMLADAGFLFISKILSYSGLNQEVFLLKTVLGFILLISVFKANIGPSLYFISKPAIRIFAQIP